MVEKTEMTMDPDTLAAFVDGELSPEDAALVMMHLEAHPQDKAFVEQVERSNAALAKAFDGPLFDAIPDRILETIRGEDHSTDNVVPFMRRALPAPVIGGLMAASLAVIVGVGVWTGQSSDKLVVGPVASASELSGVLDILPTGAVAALQDIKVEATVLSSFFDGDGRACREFEIASAAQVERGIACREAEGWSVAGRVTIPDVDPLAEGEFVPAAGESSGGLEALLDELGAGMMLTHEEEEALIADTWGTGATAR